ncbi:phosphate acyltransferase, partial [Gordonibacter pamelaeae]|nr:phosphate acyltransferase [Gordonibacter pamelaeae]
SPRVSILSIGEEEGKGNSQVKEAYDLLKMAQNLNFAGNAEGRDIFIGNIDVVVCDGFVGNVVVKMSEGLATSLVRMLKKVFTSGVLPA